MTKRIVLPLVIFAAALTGCDTLARMKDTATATAVDFIPRTVDKKIGELASLQAEATLDSVPPAAHAHLSELVEALLRVVELPGLKPTFRVTNSNMPNAFAFPNGSIFFTTKLLEIAQTPEEILAVAGHELAHVTERHSMQQLVTRAAFTVVLNFVVGDVAGLADLLNTGSSLLNLKFSRDHEREADAVGVDFLGKAQLPHRGAAAFFQRMKEFEESNLATQETMKYLSFLATHPQTDERVAWAKNLPPDTHIKVPEPQRKAFAEIKKLYPLPGKVPAQK